MLRLRQKARQASAGACQEPNIAAALPLQRAPDTHAIGAARRAHCRGRRLRGYSSARLLRPDRCHIFRQRRLGLSARHLLSARYPLRLANLIALISP